MTLTAGIYTALLTPFGADGSRIDHGALAALIDHNLQQGITGLYVGGTTSEVFLMDTDERAEVLRVVAEHAQGKCKLIAHVGDINPKTAHHLAHIAADVGYDSISAVPPFYFGFSFEELKVFYRTLAAATELPFVIYNFPALTGVTMSAAQITELLELPGVVALKNTAPDYYALEQLRRANPEKLLFNGYDETMLAGLTLGADGGIGSTYNVQGYKFRDLVAAVDAGDVSRAAAVQAEINELIDVIVEHGVLRSLKYLLDLEGLTMGDCREPFLPLSAAAKGVLSATHARLLG